MSSSAARAVFLSYASQDTEAAKRICDALRAAGVEVWFDQNELVGGDAWDAKIRGQIGSCALFVPIISANTQARREGYFRLEWKLAAQRTHMISDDTPFLLPVVIDETRDAEARVPAEFKNVQWTRLRPVGSGEQARLEDGDVEKFGARVVRLLDGEAQAPVAEAKAAASAAPSAPAENRKLAWMGYAWAAVGIGFGLFYALRPMWLPKREPAAKPAPAAAVAAPQSEAQRLVAKAREVLDQGDEMNRENYALAEELLKRAEAADVAEASAWSLHAWLSADLYRYGLDRTEARLAQIQAQASRAMSLAPDSLDAQLAMLRSQTATRAAPEEITRKQAELAEKFPDDPRVYRLYGLAHAKDSTTFEKMARGLERWPNDPRLQGDLLNSLLLAGRFDEASERAEKFTRGRTGARVLAAQVFIQLWWHGDVAAAAASVARWPSWFLLEDRGAGTATVAALMNRTPVNAIDTLRRFPRDYIRDSFFTGPRSALTAWAYEAAGQAESAAAEWRVVVQVCDRELAAVPNDGAALHWKAWALARLGQKAEAQQLFRVLQQRRVAIEGSAQVTGGLAGLALALGDADEALRELARLGSYDPQRTRPPSRALFDLNPLFDPIRTDPRFQVLRDAAPAPAPIPVATVVDEKSVAVLAFANLSDDKANEYFSDGIAEELLNVLSKVSGLKVSARTSAFSFKGRNVPVAEIARQLGVAYVVDGSVRKAGDKVRITAQLIKAADGFQVWSDTFTRDLKDVFAVQDEIAGIIAQNLRAKMTATHERAVVNPEVYALILQARHAAATQANDGARQAIGFYQQALARDPKSADAWAEMALNYVQLGRFGGMPTPDGMREARIAARRALDLDAEHPFGLLALAWVQRTNDRDWRGAIASFRRALANAPENVTIMSDAAICFLNVGFVQEAEALAARAVDRDPLNPRAQWSFGAIMLWSGRPERAIESYRRATALVPNGDEYHSHLARALAIAGRLDEARLEVQREPNERYRLVALATVQYVSGQRAEGDRTLQLIIDKYGDTMAGYLANLSALAGRNDDVFRWLERGYETRDAAMAWVKTNATYRTVTGDPRWEPFLRKMGLADDQLR